MLYKSDFHFHISITNLSYELDVIFELAETYFLEWLRSSLRFLLILCGKQEWCFVMQFLLKFLTKKYLGFLLFCSFLYILFLDTQSFFFTKIVLKLNKQFPWNFWWELTLHVRFILKIYYLQLIFCKNVRNSEFWDIP